MRVCALLLLVLVTAACGSPAKVVGPPASVRSITLIVAGQGGVVELGEDGRLKRTLSRTPARTVRRLPDGKLVFLTADLREVRQLAPQETVLATLPDALPPCDDPTPNPNPNPKKKKKKTWRQLPIPLVELDLLRPDDFGVTGDGRLVCLQLRDRRGEEAKIELDVAIERATGTMSLGYRRPDKCARRLPVCLTDARLRPPGSGPAPPGFRRELASASGRWVLVSANATTGEFATRDLFLYDARSGAIFPLRPGTWPPPLGATSPAAMTGTTLDAIEGTELRWLDPDDLLLVDSVLIVPGQWVVELPGDVAR